MGLAHSEEIATSLSYGYAHSPTRSDYTKRRSGQHVFNRHNDRETVKKSSWSVRKQIVFIRKCPN